MLHYLTKFNDMKKSIVNVDYAFYAESSLLRSGAGI
jgi:hypothetical protein